ncbi:hypothetical protein [Salipiger abyssi]|uniref:Sulfotransferase family protein n=1 Tax=Salipiger abyssi TaxID=1250539 RepID=A0A1P8V0K2_9RHOB|nr:hypothetical protein [Salipiger abyssi]APZ55182.1 Sulfotransferase family protein [Salipiger abyssi]
MTASDSQYDRLRQELDEAAQLIRSHAGPQERGTGTAPALPLQSLLDQLHQLQAQTEAQNAAPIRLLKHFACTGGTIISKCLAAMPNAVLLSEIDPLSVNHMTTPSKFAPTDLIKQMRYGRQGISDALAVEIFLGGLAPLHAALKRAGQRLILREHSHSHYCTAADWRARPAVQEMLSRDYAVLPLISVRHPMSSFLSLKAAGWIQFAPATLEEYARRYLAFLDDNATCPIVYYEDFVDTPETVLENICRSLELRYDAQSSALVMAIHMSGDSGRSSDEIAARPARDIPDEIAEQSATSPAYAELCKRLRYPPLPG